MANIIKQLEKEVANDRKFVNAQGDTLTGDGIMYAAKKKYMAGLKDGSIPFECSFDNYYASYMEEYIPVVAVISVIKDTIRHGGEQPDMERKQSDKEPCTDNCTQCDDIHCLENAEKVAE